MSASHAVRHRPLLTLFTTPEVRSYSHCWSRGEPEVQSKKVAAQPKGQLRASLLSETPLSSRHKPDCLFLILFVEASYTRTCLVL